MSTISRRIEITGSDGGFGRVASNLAEELERSFESANEELERMSGNAQDFGEILSGRLNAIETSVQQAFDAMKRRMDQQNLMGKDRIRHMRDEVKEAERALRVETERARLQEKMRYQNRMREASESGAKPDELKQIREEHASNIQDIETAQSIRILQLRNLRGLTTAEEHNIRAGSDGNKQEVDGNGGRYYGAAVVDRGSGALRSIMQGVLSGLGIAGLFSIAGFIGKMINEGVELDNAEASTRGLGMQGIGSAPGFGKKRADMLAYARQANQAAGRADYDATSNLAFEKRFSQDENSLLGLTAGLRTEGRGRTASSVTLEMLNYFKRSDLFNVRRGDFTQLGEKVQFNTRMLEMQGNQMMTTNATTNAQLLELFGKSGIGDQRTMGFVENINQSITNPNNDFSRAFIMRSLRARNPNMSLFELMKQQEQGIFGEGTFGQILGDMRSTFSGDELKMNIAQLFGLKNFQAEQIANMSAADAARIGSQEDIQKYLSGQGMSSISLATGQGGVGVMSRRMAEINDWFASNGVQAIRKIDEYITTYEKKGFGAVASQMFGDIVSAIETGFEKATAVIKEQFSEKAINDALGIIGGVKDANGNIIPGTEPSVANLASKSMFIGGNPLDRKRQLIAAGVDYNQKIEPPAIEMYEPVFSKTRTITRLGDDGLRHQIPIDVMSLQGNDLAGGLKGKHVQVEIPDKSYGQYTAAQIVELFAYAVQNGLEKVSFEQAKMIIEQGFQPSVDVLKQLQISNLPVQNKTYSTQK